MRLPVPELDSATQWTRRHLGHVSSDEVRASPRFRGGQTAADQALAVFDVSGYASRRNEVWPPERRGASALSPYIRHGLLPLPRVWEAVEGGPSRDVRKFRDELLWQEYARHLYARVGRGSRRELRHRIEATARWDHDPWWREMACMDLTVGELERDGWLVNQTRMWLASQWAVRAGADWREGEDLFYQHLLDGSRAANRLGWQWTAGALTGKSYGFSRWQVEKRASGVCDSCSLRNECPIQDWPPDPIVEPVDPPVPMGTRSGPDPAAGPSSPEIPGRPEAVWITAESLGDADPALAAHPDLAVVFVFDQPLLARLQLSGKRLVFLAETLADLAGRRVLEVHLGRPAEILMGRAVAATFTPVPGWARIAGRIEPVALHPWPWLRRPDGRPVSSFSRWARSTPVG